MGDGQPEPGPSPSPLDLGTLLAAAEAAPPVAAADAVGAALAEALGAEEVSFLIADYSGDSLIRLAHASLPGATRRTGGTDTAERVPLAGSPQGRALSGQSVEVVESDDGTWLYAPVTSRGEAVGVLELRLARSPDAQTLLDVAGAAHALAYIVIANRRYTDLYEWGQRSVPLSLAAEIQHRLLPGAYTLEAGQFTLAAWLEPAGEVGGDTFDFSLDRDALFFSMTDAMGHSVNSALLATLLVGSVRNGRRRGAGIAEQAALANAALAVHARRSEFVTGQIARVDLASGTAEIVNAGHPLPLRMRGGEVDEVQLDVDLPFGTMATAVYRAQALALEPGDRLMFVTDGVLERESANIDIRAILAKTREAHPREAVRSVIHEAVRVSGGTLNDDATVLCLDWHGGPPRDRETTAGADTG
ncbi:MAG: serine/threonine-protein phosphatase [Solirubrobacterales bacterium]|nr:serine/threonine-protein phosphatase [Solirubrobacterales bacterium]